MFALENRRRLPPHQLERVAEAAHLPRCQLTDGVHVIRVLENLVDVIRLHRAVVDAIHSFENLQSLRFVALKETSRSIEEMLAIASTHRCENKLRRFRKKEQTNSANSAQRSAHGNEKPPRLVSHINHGDVNLPVLIEDDEGDERQAEAENAEHEGGCGGRGVD